MRGNKGAPPIHWFRVVVAFALLGGCIWFIWSNSMLSPQDSSRRSQMVADFLMRAMRMFFDDNSRVTQYLIRNVRKVAHAIEFFALGSVCVMILLVLRRINLNMVLHAILLLLFVAVTDESIQLFTGRGAQVSDILLDFSGGLSGICISFFLIGVGKALFTRS